MDLLGVEGLSGREGKVADLIRKKLRAAGCKPAWMKHDQAHKRIPGDFEIGNLIVKIPGTIKGPRRLFMGHMDTVPLCRGCVPVRRGNRITSKTRTALGADNRTACAALVAMVETLLKHGLPHPPLTILFTVGEEIGLWGARKVDLGDLGKPAMGFNIDHGDPNEIMVGAIGADRWEVEVLGHGAHAGVHPEHGVSAALIASRAIADVAARGYFGKVRLKGKKGTSNVGILRGGDATNQVTDHVYVKGESRSHDRAFIDEITGAYREAFARAARGVKNHKGKTGRIKFKADRDYPSFKMDRREPVVKLAVKTAAGLGLKPSLKIVDGGLDANFMNARGLPTVTLGAGQHGPHTVEEYADIREYLAGCRLLLALATAD
jgi:tripeptide aminopeptidase